MKSEKLILKYNAIYNKIEKQYKNNAKSLKELCVINHVGIDTYYIICKTLEKKSCAYKKVQNVIKEKDIIREQVPEQVPESLLKKEVSLIGGFLIESKKKKSKSSINDAFRTIQNFEERYGIK